MRIAPALAFCFLLGSIVSADPRKPAPPAMDRATWFQKFSRQQKAIQAQNHRVCFLGDSLTAFWATQGNGAWQLDFEGYSPVNCGIAADGLEQIHYRAKLLKFGRVPPEVFVVLAGTNNLARQPPDDPDQVAEGIRELAKTLRGKCPNSKILVLSILPNGHPPESPLRKKILRVNANLSKAGDLFEFLAVHHLFVDDAGNWKAGLTLDGTHLTSKGYDILARPVAKRLSEILKTHAR